MKLGKLLCILSLIVIIAGCGGFRQHANPAADHSVPDEKTLPELKGGSEPSIRKDRNPAAPGSAPEKTASGAAAPGSSSKLVHYTGPAAGKQVALTFDDGPDNRFTPLILDILKMYNVKATFFLIGERAKAHPDVVKRMVEEGHAIGNHSWDHPDFAKIGSGQALDEINKTQEELLSITGIRPSIFRPPYGILNKADEDAISGMGLNIVDWSVDSRDWAGTPATKIMEYVHKELRPGGIILEHCAGGRHDDLSNTVSALKQLIPQLKKEGYTFVTVPALFSIPDSLK